MDKEAEKIKKAAQSLEAAIGEADEATKLAVAEDIFRKWYGRNYFKHFDPS